MHASEPRAPYNLKRAMHHAPLPVRPSSLRMQLAGHKPPGPNRLLSAPLALLANQLGSWGGTRLQPAKMAESLTTLYFYLKSALSVLRKLDGVEMHCGAVRANNLHKGHTR